MPAIVDNSTASLMLAKGQLDWLGVAWDPKLDPSYIQKDPVHNHHWFTSSNTVMLYLNLKKYPFNLLPVRQAISLAIDRKELQEKSAPYAPPANPTGLLLQPIRAICSHSMPIHSLVSMPPRQNRSCRVLVLPKVAMAFTPTRVVRRSPSI
ncbi:ABC transporter substrate-binding protein [Dictyobacter kobayashii]|uniref:ABC transporter substrate-binding protein n=1 Tax=Dictyobacter kobayashii TaxID=2014872 RepID=UPI000F81C6A4